MRVHHLNCGSMCPLGGKYMDGRSPGFGPAHLVCHCLLIETNSGLVLVDSGIGLEDFTRPKTRIRKASMGLLGLQYKEEETALRQVERLGFKPSDVRHIVLTHLDYDHAGGIVDFPHAQIHLLAAEYEFALHKRGLLEIARYWPEQWLNHEGWTQYKPEGEKWFGFESVRDLKGLPPEILMVPLKGHTWGHSGVAVDTGNGWLLHAGDSYFCTEEILPGKQSVPPLLTLLETFVEMDRKARLHNQVRLRDLNTTHGNEIKIFCSHSAPEFERDKDSPR